MTPPARCRYKRRVMGGGALLRCDLPAGHDGPHVHTDEYGRRWSSGYTRADREQTG